MVEKFISGSLSSKLCEFRKGQIGLAQYSQVAKYNLAMCSESSEEPRVRETKTMYGEQDAWGNSVASLRANLLLSPIERLRKAERAARSLLELRNALKRID